MIVSGTAIVGAESPAAVIASMKETLFNTLNRVHLER